MTSRAPIEKRESGSSESPLIVKAEHLLDRLKHVSEAIATRAYELFQGRGHELGLDLDDWLRAESELLRPMPLDIVETDNRLTLRAELPGFTAEQIKVSAEPRRVMISGKAEQKTETATYTERHSKDVFRAVGLPADVDPVKLDAELKNGILTITLPKIPNREPAHVEITAN
jgi:HSP20 family protein